MSPACLDPTLPILIAKLFSIPFSGTAPLISFQNSFLSSSLTPTIKGIGDYAAVESIPVNQPVLGHQEGLEFHLPPKSSDPEGLRRVKFTCPLGPVWSTPQSPFSHPSASRASLYHGVAQNGISFLETSVVGGILKNCIHKKDLFFSKS